MSRMSELAAECDRLGIDPAAPNALHQLAGALLEEGNVFVGGVYLFRGERVTVTMIVDSCRVFADTPWGDLGLRVSDLRKATS